jgi:uncharacterized heparinase superfamily protein
MLTHRPHPEPAPTASSAAAASPLSAARQRLEFAILAVDRARRGALSRVRRSSLLGWRHRAPIAQDLVLAPPDLRPMDESFAGEVAGGSMGLAGVTAALGEASPFTVPPPTAAWARDLHGFAWLRHFSAAGSPEGEALARRLVGEWLARPPRRSQPAWSPEVAGRRTISWLSHAALLLDGADRRAANALMIGLEDHTSHLSAAWPDAPAGYPRLLALVGLVQAGLCIAGHERRLASAERHLGDELDRQVLSDGGHVSRNPAVLIELLLDLLPLRQCFIARGLEPPAALLAAVDRMTPMLHRLRLGDGQLARCNGMGATERDALATVLAYDSGRAGPAEPVSPSRYVRLQRGAAIVVVDAGGPPPLELATQACAGCLAFELSAGAELLLVNGGAPGPAHVAGWAAARGTASHNTLVLGGQSSSRLARNEGLERRLGGAPIQGPDRVACEVHEAEDGGVVLHASHDGYAGRFGLVHTRTLVLDASGTRLDGMDRLDGASGDMRFAWDVPFAVHFHLHPRAGARLAADGSADLVLPGGERWRLTASGAALAIEESTHYAQLIGPLRAQQVVLRAVCCGASDVRWTVQRVPPPAPVDEAPAPP